MFTPIRRALGMNPSEPTPQLIDQAIEHNVTEQSDLDWKSSLYHRKDKKWQKEAAKDIDDAFARRRYGRKNHTG